MKRFALVVLLLFLVSVAVEMMMVTMFGKLFLFVWLMIVVGDLVLWCNGDLIVHDVKGGDFIFGLFVLLGFFTHAFGVVGAQLFVCTIHLFMMGEVDVVVVMLGGAMVYVGEFV